MAFIPPWGGAGKYFRQVIHPPPAAAAGYYSIPAGRQAGRIQGSLLEIAGNYFRHVAALTSRAASKPFSVTY
jgi:hypothetical protein